MCTAVVVLYGQGSCVGVVGALYCRCGRKYRWSERNATLSEQIFSPESSWFLKIIIILGLLWLFVCVFIFIYFLFFHKAINSPSFSFNILWILLLSVFFHYPMFLLPGSFASAMMVYSPVCMVVVVVWTGYIVNISWMTLGWSAGMVAADAVDRRRGQPGRRSRSSQLTLQSFSQLNKLSCWLI